MGDDDVDGWCVVRVLQLLVSVLLTSTKLETSPFSRAAHSGWRAGIEMKCWTGNKCSLPMTFSLL